MNDFTPPQAHVASGPTPEYLAARTSLGDRFEGLNRPPRELAALRHAAANGHGTRVLYVKPKREPTTAEAVDEACDMTIQHLARAGLWGEVSADVVAEERRAGRKAAKKRAKKGRH